MTTTPQTIDNKKAHADNMGAHTLLQDCKPPTEEQLANNPFLIKLNDMLEPERLLFVTGDTTIYYGEQIGKTEPTANTIGLALTDKQGDTVGAVFYTPNSKAKPIVIDPTGYGAIVIGEPNKANEMIAFNDLDSGIDVYSYLMGSDKTIIVSPHKTKQCLKKMVQHWSSGSQVIVCSPIEVIAKTRDTSSGTWGRLLQWRDDDSVSHTWSMPLSLLKGDAREYRRELASQGLNITTNPKQRSYLDTYIQNYPIHKRALCVDKLGWHDKQYILPDRAIGSDSKQLIVYQSANSINSTLTQQGTLDQWRDKLCKPLAEQSRFVFSIACAFAGQLLELLEYDGGGFHLLGSSSMGKSLSLKLAASVWGNPDRYVKTWRSTDNALEGTASEHNDSFLPLDEISECDPKIVGKTVYMLANGQGKGRSTTTGHNRIAKTWRIIFLSNGEESLQNFMAQAGQKTNAGIEVRVAHIDADAGKGLKTFDSLVLAKTSEAQADKIKELSHAYYGSAGIAWLEHITSDKAATTANAEQLVSSFMSQYSDLTAQAHRVAKRFAIVSAAGEIATQAGITGWQAGQATKAVMTCLDNWLDNYGRDGEHEQRQIIEHIKAFIEQHGASRFQPCHIHIHQDFETKITNRAGYHNYDTGEYYFSTSTFDEVCSPFNKSKVLQVLDEAGLLNVTENDRKTCKVPLPFKKNRQRVYAVKGEILSCETIKSTGTAGTTHTPQGLEPVPSIKIPLGQLGQNSSIC
ncbi:DUF927 domain-containing protein [uncultured Psychrobacter sp.]|uniref:DUF927 domain-containing protein n=1 Tax=uncultured Psychrobacter sp. TaxID=259303 RepID=UPI002638568B|nr:DUF927 domain-containing protein [uncultured Psychrobacter sp.]